MRIGAVAALALLGGCVPTSFYTHPVPLGAQADQFNTTAAATERLVIVRNVMRARDRTSMIFTRIQSFQGGMSRSLSGTAGLSMDEGPGNDRLTQGVTASGSSSPTFNVAVLNDEKFHRAIETSIDLGLYQLLLQSGWRPNLLHTLFIERIVDHGRVIENDPGDYQAFHDWLGAHGQQTLQVCSRPDPQEFGPALNLSGPADLQGMAAVAAQRLQFQRAPDGVHLARPGVSRWLGFDCGGGQSFTSVRVEMQAAQAAQGANAEAHYVSNNAAGQTAGDSADQNRIYVRSVEGVLFYLGEIVREEQRRNGVPITVAIGEREEPLFVVHRAEHERPSGMVFRHEDGKTYFVPYPPDPAEEGPRERTHQVISLMVQLMGMLQSQENVPTTATVRVIP